MSIPVVDLAYIGLLAKEMEDSKRTVDQEIEITERRLKILRTMKQMLATPGEPKPRGSRKKETASV